MSFDSYQDFVTKREAQEAVIAGLGTNIDFGNAGFTGFGTNRVSLNVGVGNSAFFSDRGALVSTILGPSLREILATFPVFKNAPPPSILDGDNEGIPAVIVPIPAVPPTIFRAPPSVGPRPPVRMWPPPECCY